MGKRKKTRPDKHHHVYVIELDKAVLQHKKFTAANPEYNPVRSCLYVGMTGLTPDERFRQHQSGKKSNGYVHKHGKYLRRRLFEKYNPMAYEDACKMERELARKLRKKGYAVWQK